MIAAKVYTNLDSISADLYDVIRLFCGGIEYSPEDVALHCTHAQTGDEWHSNCTLHYFGKTFNKSMAAQFTNDALEATRRIKRLHKMCAYHAFVQATGNKPLWGGLTGIRPMRLWYEQHEAGFSAPEIKRRLQRQFDISPEKIALLEKIFFAQHGLRYAKDNLADIYISIPFCTTRCTYCSFAALPLGDGGLVQPYIKALKNEIRGSAEILKTAGYMPRALYIGGGTPTAISAGQLEEILTCAAEFFPNCEEFTVEAGRPDTIDTDKLRIIRAAGARRISVNPQTMNEKTLVVIGRNHLPWQTLEAYYLAREAGFEIINMDMIAALPGETIDDFKHTLDIILNLSPENITIHTLALKRASKLSAQQGFEHTNAQHAAHMVDAGMARTLEAGYQPYYIYRQKHMAGNLENVGYCKPGTACLYNIGNMEETVPVLAMGAGAITKWIFNGKQRIERAPNVSDINHYISRWSDMLDRKKKIIL